ncbi:hypothetical protein Gdia_1610 [Gluconacetobacter diazotrophicus PA1 5]|nr:hypothetical protein Gdia_1610 [Gluconacetobacter diazotrophicus PA1 5]TWB00145.1 hypothetical protein FBZ86_1398 [Gluconacetobacter diazotrophicus]
MSSVKVDRFSFPNIYRLLILRKYTRQYYISHNIFFV